MRQLHTRAHDGMHASWQYSCDKLSRAAVMPQGRHQSCHGEGQTPLSQAWGKCLPPSQRCRRRCRRPQRSACFHEPLATTAVRAWWHILECSSVCSDRLRCQLVNGQSQTCLTCLCRAGSCQSWTSTLMTCVIDRRRCKQQQKSA